MNTVTRQRQDHVGVIGTGLGGLAVDISNTDGITVNFSETHDNPRLAGKSKTYAKMRTALCALSSHNGAFGFALGQRADMSNDVCDVLVRGQPPRHRRH